MSFLLDFVPLLAFFVVSKLYGLLPATAVLIALTVIAVPFHYLKTKKIPYVPIVTAVLVAMFGGLSLYLHDETFIKVKPTMVNVLFAVVLWGGWKLGKRPLIVMMGSALTLSEDGWRVLHRNYALFFVVMAGVNEYVWRSFPTPVWIDFKVFGLMGLSIAFSVVQLMWIQRYTTPEVTTND